MITACLGMKGGSGKTTLATNLAAGLAARPEEKVLLLDTDEQASAARWNLERPEKFPLIKILQLPDARLLKERFSELESKFTHIIVDGSPRMDHLSTVTLGIADLVLIPIQASPLDIWASEQLADRVHKARQLNPEFQAIFVLNRFNPNTLISRSALNALETLGLPILQASMGQRVAFGESMALGVSVLEYSDHKASAEMEAILTCLDGLKKGDRPFLSLHSEKDTESLKHQITETL